MKILLITLFLSTIALSENNVAQYPYDQNLEDITGLVVPDSYKPNRKAFRHSGLTLPETFDWRTNGLTPVENQGVCGSCYAFATASVMEDAIKIFTGKEVELSEQYLLDCSFASGDSQGCNGGWEVHDYHMLNGKALKGGISGKEYPYTQKAGTCRTDLKPIDTIEGWKEVTNDVNSIKEAILKYGPVWSTVYADTKFQNYKSGLHCGKNYQSNHAITLVGWTKRGWILKNSWSKNWGMDGYMELGFNCNNVGYGTSHIIYKNSPAPTPTPEPSPTIEPTPEPTPTWEPSPTPKKYCDGESELRSTLFGREVILTISNNTAGARQIFWINYIGRRVKQITLGAGYKTTIRSYVNHAWVSLDGGDNCVETFTIKNRNDKAWNLK